MNKSIEINYRDNDALRASFNELVGKVFGLSFENWYQNGFWKNNYIPYSVVIDGKVVANVSVNRCDVNYNGEATPENSWKRSFPTMRERSTECIFLPMIR